MKSISKSVLGVAAVLLTLNVHAQNGEVSGQVTDVEGLPISGATVDAGVVSTQTDEGGIYLLSGVEQSARVVVSFTKDGFADTFGAVDLSVLDGDADGDGVVDGEDSCPMSDQRPLVMMGDFETGVENIAQDNGCTLQDEVFACSSEAEQSAQEKVQKDVDKGKDPEKIDEKYQTELAKAFGSCVKGFSKDLNKDDVIDKDDEKALKETAKDVKKAHEKGGELLPLPHDIVGPASSATLDKVMVAVGTPQVLDAGAGGTVEQDGFKVTFPPGAIDATGNVEVVISPIDVSTDALGAFPGDFQALDANGGQVLLETFSLMDVEITQNGEPVVLADGAKAQLEFLLPTTTPLGIGDAIALWFFDEDLGIWLEEGSAVVGASTTIPDRLAAFAMVSHFSWWNCDQPIATQTSISGRVVDSNGDPVAGVGVRASGVDYNGTSYDQTDSNGEYCMNVRINSVVDVAGSLVFNGISVDTNTLSDVPTGGVNLRCQDGGAQVVADLVLAGLSCVNGEVQDESGVPVAGVLVQSTGGGFATTDINGQYCLTAPTDAGVTLFSAGFVAVTTTTAGEASCAGGGCAVAPVLSPPVSGTTACLTGRVDVESYGEDETLTAFPLEGAVVQAADLASGFPVGTSDVTDVNGEYCVEGVPLNTDVIMEVYEDLGEVLFQLECSGSAMVDSGVVPGTCATTSSCVVVPDETCFGEGETPSLD